jgi:cytochrome c-type biogenesis protein CcmE
MPYRKFLWPALGLVAATVVALVITSIGNDLTYYLTPTEAVAQRAETGTTTRFRLGGQVVPGSLVIDGNVKLFSVTDGAATVEVVLAAPTPPLFAEGLGVVVEGQWRTGGSDLWEFVADLALVRHDENYEAPTTLP